MLHLITDWPGKSADENGIAHPAAYHMLDVLAVAERLVEDERDVLTQALLVLVALHDLGKIGDPFKAMLRDGARQPYRHWEYTEVLLRHVHDDVLADRLGGDTDGRRALYAAVAGHHGGPPTLDDRMMRRARREISAEAIDAQVSFIAYILDLYPEARLEGISARVGQACSWALAGLTTVADWVGSNQTWFPPTLPDHTLDEYMQIARRQAHRAVEAAGLMRPTLAATDIAAGWALRPMQGAAQGAAMSDGPTLAFIEDATGSGKTEAALILAQRMMQAGKGQGLFFALPTMATANAMIDRLAPIVRKLFNEPPSLALAHGRAALHNGFRTLDGTSTTDTDEGRPQIAAAPWLTEGRRRALLATVGVGTIDQALMGVLPTRFATLRLFGLARKILIIDEAHDYDPYMQAELEGLLRFHAALGGSAIVMTATLPTAMRQAYERAFARGISIESIPDEDRAYPALRLIGCQGRALVTPPAHAPTVRKVTVGRLPDASAAVERIVAAAQNGAACVWVRNAVDEAIAGVEALRAAGIDADLLHARFAMVDRLAKESAAMIRFGRAGKGRAGRVLVGTQVLQASLDLDFDVMVSDLAPIGDVIQRAGRLWRHMEERLAKKRAVSGPHLDIISADPHGPVEADWLAPLGAGRWVYDAATQWRTARCLFETGEIAAPEGVRALIEAVHGDSLADVPPALIDAEHRALGDATSEREHAKRNVVDFQEGYRDTGDVWDDTIFPTRLGKEQRTLVLARYGSNGLTFWAGDADPYYAAALSEVSANKNKLDALPIPDQTTPEIVTLTQGWPDWKRETIRVAPVLEDGTICKGLRYDVENGLSFDTPHPRG